MTIPFKIPRSVMCGATKYTVTRHTSKTDKEIAGCYGYCMADKAKIVLDRRLSGEVARKTLEHEVGHATLAESGAQYILSKFIEDPQALHELEECLIRIWLPSYQASIGSF